VTAKAWVLNAPSVCRLDTLAAGRVEVTCPLTSFQLFLTYVLAKCYAVGGSSIEKSRSVHDEYESNRPTAEAAW
jgi:hypothetical protein